MVLRHRLLLPCIITAINHPSHSARTLLKLLLTSKATRDVALDIYYGENRFRFMRRNAADQDNDRPAKVHWLWKLPNVAFLGLVRNIEVVIKASVRTGFKMAWDDESRTEWPYLFLDERKTATIPASNWQKHFTNLTLLKIVVEFAPHPAVTEKNCFGSLLATNIKNMKKVRIQIKPRKVEVEVRGLHSLETPECNSACVEGIATAIREAVDLRGEGANRVSQTTRQIPYPRLDDHPDVPAAVARGSKRKRSGMH